MQVSPIFMAAALLVASNVFMTFAWYGHLRTSRRGHGGRYSCPSRFST